MNTPVWFASAFEAKEPKQDIFEAFSSPPEGRRVSFSDEPPQSLTFAVNGFEKDLEEGAWPSEPAPAPAPEAPRRRWQDFGGAPEAPAAVAVEVPVPQLERRFSFSLTDLPEHLVRAVGPRAEAQEPERRQEKKWNPLDGVKRHWRPSDVEFEQQLGATTGLASHEHPKSLQIMGSLNEQQKAELRAQDLRKKITKLESALGGSPDSGHVSIAAPPCRNGLGIVLSELTVSQVIDPLAQQAGWQVGDSILKVNGITILNSVQLSGELAKALSANRAVGRPMHFEVWRHPPANMNHHGVQPSLAHPSTHPLGHASHPGATYQHLSHSHLPTAPYRGQLPSEPVTQWTGPKLVAPAEPPQSCVIS